MTSPTALFQRNGDRLEYRVEPAGDRAVVVLHGGHMHAGIALGEQVYRDLGFTVIVPSRPGYGRTPIRSDGDCDRFADLLAHLVTSLGHREVAAVVGISAGGPSAIRLAVRHETLIQRVILQAAVSSLPWPDRITATVGRFVFNPVIERGAWAATRLLLRLTPRLGLSVLLTSLSSGSGRTAVDSLDAAARTEMLELFTAMRSGHGFLNDLDASIAPSLIRQVRQPTLVMASRNDGSVGMAHAEELVRLITRACLEVNDAPSHLMWFGPAQTAIDNSVRTFLVSPPHLAG